MLITKKINNNVAMAQDDAGNELVVFGKGIGFRQTPYELEETTQIHRVFRNVGDDLMNTINSISGEVIGVSMDTVRLAEVVLDCQMNPNLYLTLADHLQFAAERFASGIVMESPLAADVPLVYPEEFDLGKTCLQFMENVTGIRLPESEACSVALHIINAEGAGSTRCTSTRTVQKTLVIIDDVTDIVERKMFPEGGLDKKSHAYLRFVTHLKFLVKRLMGEGDKQEADLPLLMDLAKNYPCADSCSKAIARYLRWTHGFRLTDEERFYLLMYLIKLRH